MMGRPRNKYPLLQHDHGEALKLTFDKDSGAISLQSQGAFHCVNGVIIGKINPDWNLLEAHAQAPISVEHRQAIEHILATFAEERAGEIGAIPWNDKKEGFIDDLKQLDEAAIALLAAFNKQTPATDYILKRIAQIKEPHFSRDEFYPQLTQLIHRTHLLLQEITAEKKQGVRLGIGNAWRRFVFGVAGIYREMTGKCLTTPELNTENHATTRPSPFLLFAHSAMLQVPENLRVHVTGGGENGIYSFSGALSEVVTELGLREFPKKRTRKPR